MSKAHVEFFATPEEQLDWLRELLSGDRVWCVVRTLPPNWGIELVASARLLRQLSLTKSDATGGTQVFLGRKDLVPVPIWRTEDNGGRDIDFIRSQAIQYSPSVVVREHILLQGQMAIMRRSYYNDAGVDPKPLHQWFRQLANSFSELKTAGTVVLRDPAHGTEKAYPDIIATAQAAEWQRTGHLLKQFVDGAYEFIVRLRD